MSKDEEEERGIRLQEFLGNLTEQDQKFRSLRPPILDYITKNPSALSKTARYELRHHDDENLKVWDFCPATMPGDYLFYRPGTRKPFFNDWLNLSRYTSDGGVFMLEDYYEDQRKTTLDVVTVIGAKTIKLSEPPVYHGSGYVRMSRAGEGGRRHYASLRSWMSRIRSVEFPGDKQARSLALRLQIVPSKGQGKDSEKLMIRLQDVESRKILQVDNETNFELFKIRD